MCNCPNGIMSYMGRPLSWWGSCILIFKAHKNGAFVVYYRTKLGRFLEVKLFLIINSDPFEFLVFFMVTTVFPRVSENILSLYRYYICIAQHFIIVKISHTY
jgi:hypothetical protein